MLHKTRRGNLHTQAPSSWQREFRERLSDAENLDFWSYALARFKAKMVVAIAHSPQSERHLVSGDSTLEQLRQTLSRTPSKGTTTFQVFTSKTSSPAQSPRSSHAQALSDVPLTLFPISAKKKRPILRHMSPMRFTRGSLGGQRAKRILQESTDNGNSSLQSFATIRAVSPNEMQISTEDENNMLGPHHALGRKEKSVYFDIVKSSPLKRSESNFDSAQAASPSAKRRSVHGSSFAPEFNLPERETLFEGNDEIPTPTAQYSPTFRGKNALRSASLATRFDTVPAIKSRPTVGNIWDIQAAKARNRLSLDFPMPDDNDDSPFALDVSTQSSKEVPSLGKLTLPPRHPLSRTMTQSSSNSDIAEDSPTHGPIRKHLGDFRRPFPEFTRSLPIGGTRPRNVSQDSDESGYATPSNYRLAKPHPAAFMSTGLISKRNRNLTTEQLDMTTNVSDMPDTPCKRPISVIALMPMPTPSVNPTKARSNRQTSHSFGTPSTPFNPQKSIKHTGFGPAIFGSDFNQGSSRRGSFADKVEDVPKSPVKSYYNRNVALFDISSTPTKQASANNPQIFMDENVTIMDSKSIMVPKIKVARVRELDDNCLSSPSPKLRFKDLDSIPFFSKRSARGRMQCPSPLSKFSVLLSSKDTKLSSTASPIVDLPKSLNPVVPPDPSSLSISGHSEKNSFVRRTSFNGSLSMNLPATPTAARDSMRKFSSHAISVTPSNNNSAPFNVDPSITSRFDKVEPLSTGEFSQVFRVFAFAKRVPLREIVSTTSKGNARANSVWVVKKSKNAYIGPRDRIRKLQEVETLKALGQADHTIRYFDHWEHHDHLYIQTEYCEEGTLHGFLMHAGQSARLDDFRIWKIMLEMSKVNFSTHRSRLCY